MKQLNCPKKYTAIAQMWISVLLVVLAAIMAFTPLLTFSIKGSGLASGIEDLFDELGQDDFEISDDMAEINVGTVDVVNSGIVLTKFVKLAIDVSTAESQNDIDALKKAERDLDDLLSDEKTVRTLIFGFAMAAQVMDLDELINDGSDYDKYYNDDAYDINDYTEEMLGEMFGVIYTERLLERDIFNSYIYSQNQCYREYRDTYLKDLGIANDETAFHEIPNDKLFADAKEVINDYMEEKNLRLMSGAPVTLENINELKFELDAYAFSDAFSELRSYFADHYDDRFDRYIADTRYESNLSDYEIEALVGLLYTDGLVYNGTVNNYLNGQYQAYREYPALYLKSLGIENMSTSFFAIDREKLFQNFRDLVDEFLAENRITDARGETVTYETLPAFKESLIDRYGAEEGAEKFKDRLSSSYSIDNYLSNNDYALKNCYSGIVSSAEYNENTQAALFLLDNDYITYDEFISAFDFDFNSDADPVVLREYLTDEDFDRFIAEDHYNALMNISQEDIEREEREASTIGSIVEMALAAMILVFVVGFVTIWPFIMAIIALVTLIKALTRIKRSEEYAGKVAGKMAGPLGFTIAIALLLTFFPGITMGPGLVVILVLSILSVVTNLVISRLRAYNEIDFKFATLVQGTALVQGIAFILLFVGMLNTGFLKNMITSVCTYVSKTSVAINSYTKQVDFYNSFFNANMSRPQMNLMFLIDMALVIAAAIIALFVAISLVKAIASQLGLVKGKKPGSLATPIWALIACILPLVAINLQNEIGYSMTATGVKTRVIGSILNVSDDSMGALIAMFIGAFLLLASAIAYRIVKKKLCPAMAPELEKLILAGNAPAYGDLSTETATAEGEAVATEDASAAEDVSVEETAPTTEEAAAEEAASTEEAPASDDTAQ